MWSASSFEEWLGMLSRVRVMGVSEAVRIVGCMGLLGVLAGLFGHTQRQWTEGGASGAGGSGSGGRVKVQWGKTIGVVVGCVLILAPIKYQVRSKLNAKVAAVCQSLRSDRLNDYDKGEQVNGYYENMTKVDRFNPKLFEITNKTTVRREQFDHSGAMKPSGDYRTRELIPGFTTTFHGIEHRVNRYGMRDRDSYEVQKPAGTYRIALVGASDSMGWGVGNLDTYENVLEDRLNRENDGSRYSRYEALNFAVNAYGPIERLMMFENRVLAFEPDMVFYATNAREYQWIVQRIMANLKKKVEPPYGVIKEALVKAGIQEGVHEVLLKGTLKPYAPEILSWIYGRFVEIGKERGIAPVMIYIPQPGGEPFERAEVEETLGMARAAGFTVIDLAHAYDGRDISTMRVEEWDTHPNTEAHRILEGMLYDGLRKDPVLSRHFPGGDQGSAGGTE
jgi:hypothetical protein